ncbi:hypothetical protein [Croceimicrobium hydrocarbonivorans]|uniref:Lipoprotein n=1 Tax=Croceimicrobium hydrocarbonivorans TaxID=2761580 RepID=A0A7H0VG21_9FLAO|nr:hypothetical protein [Croceimicrobium hydrocarbonivorans]QNR24669.1 hypothetical protein H4K34_02160 [Croceimicrobium hydrocarbonivorans]
MRIVLILLIAASLSACKNLIYQSRLDNLLYTGDWVPVPIEVSSFDPEQFYIQRIQMDDYKVVKTDNCELETFLKYFKDEFIARQSFFDHYFKGLTFLSDYKIYKHQHRSRIVEDGVVYVVVYDAQKYFYCFSTNQQDKAFNDFDESMLNNVFLDL